MKYKAIALDIDGTLKSSDKKILPKTKEKLIELSKKGVTIILASGRPTPGLEAEAKELEFYKYGGYLLSFNGAKVVNFQTKEILYEKVFDKAIAYMIYRHAKKFHLGVCTYKNQDVLSEDVEDEYIAYEAKLNRMKLKHVDSFINSVDDSVNKVLLTGKPEYVAEIIDEFKRPYGTSLSIYRSAPFFIEVMAKNIDKARSLEKILEYLGYTKDELIAFGDGYNDLSMIEYAGLGVAMENAVEEVKQRANCVTRSNDEEGIYEILNELEIRGEI